MSFTYRTGLGRALTYQEMDANLAHVETLKDLAVSGASLSASWAEGSEPGGPGTKSSQAYAGEADAARIAAETAQAAAEVAAVAPARTGAIEYAIDMAGQAIRAQGALTDDVNETVSQLTDDVNETVSQLTDDVNETVSQLTDALPPAAIVAMIEQALEVAGKAAQAINGGHVTLRAGTLADPALRIGTVGLYSSIANTLSVAIAGAEIIRVTSAGITVYGTITEAP